MKGRYVSNEVWLQNPDDKHNTNLVYAFLNVGHQHVSQLTVYIEVVHDVALCWRPIEIE